MDGHAEASGFKGDGAEEKVLQEFVVGGSRRSAMNVAGVDLRGAGGVGRSVCG